MEPPKPETMPRRSRRIIVVISVSAIVVLAGFLIWEVFVRPRSLSEVYGFEHWTPGSTVTIAGTITSIEREDTSYGPRVYLGLDRSSLCAGLGSVLGDPGATYHLGDSFQTILHFQAYTINGAPAVSAPELHCPFPSQLRSISQVADVSSFVGGRLLLVYNGTASNGTVRYEIVAENGAAYRPDRLPATLRKSLPIQGSNPRLPAGGPVNSAARWSELDALQYLGVTGAYSEFPIVDEMASLATGVSRNASLHFVDVNRDGLVDDGDRLDLNLAPTTSPNAWDTYQLIIGGLFSAPQTYAAAAHLILNGPMGPLEVALPERQDPHFELRYAGDQYGVGVTSEIAVRLRFGPAPALSDVGFLLSTGNATANATVSALPTTLSNGVTLALTDSNGNGRLDTGDVFRVGNLVNRSSVFLHLSAPNLPVGRIWWLVGYGEPIGQHPVFTFTAQGTNPWQATANVFFWSPELALDRTLRVSVLENGIAVLTDRSVPNGTVGTFANGTLAFADSDADGTLSSGDRFTLTGASANRYELEVSVLYESPWRVFF